jgi:hypothetical protein
MASTGDQPQELNDLEELETRGTVRGKTPNQIINEMNPGNYIPTGAELARELRSRKKGGNQE